MRRSCISIQVGHLEVLGPDRLRPALMEEGVLSPVGGANGGLGHMVENKGQRRKFSNKVQLNQEISGRISIKATALGAPDGGRS